LRVIKILIAYLNKTNKMGVKIKILLVGILLLLGIVYLVYGKIVQVNPNLSPDSSEDESSLSEEIVDAGQFKIKVFKDDNGEIQATNFIKDIGFSEGTLLESKNDNKEFIGLAVRNVSKTITCNPLTPLATPTTPQHIQIPTFDKMENKGRYVVFAEYLQGGANAILRGYDLGLDEKYGTNDDVGAVTLDSNIGHAPLEFLNPVVNDNGEVVYTKNGGVSTSLCSTLTKEQVKCQFGPGTTCQNTLTVLKSIPYATQGSICLEPQFIGRSITHDKLAYTYSTNSQGALPQVYIVETYNLTSGASQIIAQYTGPWGSTIIMPFEVIISNFNDFVFWRLINAFIITPYYVDSYASLSGVSQIVNLDTQQDIRAALGPPITYNSFGAGIFYFDKTLQKYIYIASTRNPANLNYLMIYYKLFSPQGTLINNGILNPSVQNKHQTSPLTAYSSRLNYYILSFNSINTVQSLIELYLYDSATNTFQPHETIIGQPTISFNTFNYPNVMTTIQQTQTSFIYGTTCS